MRTHLSVLVAAAMSVTSCGGGDDSSSANPEPSASAPALVGGDESAVASVEALDLVWALDGESVGLFFDYTEPIDRARYDAGLRLELSISTVGDIGGIDPDLVLPVKINGDQIDDGGTTFGPERSLTRPDRANIEIVETGTGFLVSIDVGRPLSPVTLVERRAAAVESGLDPDLESQSLGNEYSMNVAGILDFPSAPVNGRNAIEYGMRGSIEFGNGFVIETVNRTYALTVTETQSVETGRRSQCGSLAESYLELFDLELADPGVVLLDRLRAFETLRDAAYDLDCNARDVAIPICQAAEAVDDAPAGLLDRHLAVCPDDVEMVEATVFEPTFRDGIVQMVIPRTREGRPAYSVALSFPAWKVFTTSEGPTRQKIALSATDDLAVMIDIDVSAMPPSLLADRVAEVVPEWPDATLLVDDMTSIADRPATRFIADNGSDASAGFGDFEVGTVIEVDDERLLYLRGSLAGASLDGDKLVEMMACVESSIVIEEFVSGTTLVPAADCTALGGLTADDVVEPSAESADEPEVDEPADETPPLSGASGFDGSIVTLFVPAIFDDPAHIVTVAAPAWTLADINDSSSSQVVDLVGPETRSQFFVAARLVGDADDRIDGFVEPLDDWVAITDTLDEIAGRQARIVTSERMNSDGDIERTVELAFRLDEGRAINLLLRLGAGSSLDLATELANVLSSLTITS